MLNVYATEHVHSATVCAAFAAGCGAPIVPPFPLLPGDVAMYGCLRGLRPTLVQAQREGRRWLYLDNGYFRPGHYDGYYRATWNALQHEGSGTAAPDRWERLGLSIAPWRTGGGHIVVCPPTDVFAGLMGFDGRRWLAGVLDTLRRHTDREIRIRLKGKKPGPPLATDLDGAWAVVTHSSNAAVEALLAGVPVFVTNPCGAYRLGEPDLTKIETPRRPDGREQWAWNLAANQWTLAEMSDGTCWRMLNEEH